MKARSDAEITREARARLKVSPIRYDPNLGNYFWEGIPECSHEECPLYTTCIYPKDGVCGLRKKYLSVIERLLLGCVDKKDAKNKLKIGFHLLPLYSQLFTAKLAYIKKETIENSKEIRGILRSIETIFRTLKQTRALPGEKVTEEESDYYDQMAESGFEEAQKKLPEIKPIKKRKQKRGPKVKVKLSQLNKEFGVI